MISDKMKAFVAGSSAIRAMFVEGKKLEKQYGEENVYDFSLGNPSVEAPDALKKAIIKILEEEAPCAVHGYTDNAGFVEVRDAIATHVNAQYATQYDATCVVMTCGAAGGLNIILKTLLNSGDEVVVFAPFFGEYKSYVGNYDGVLTVVAADSNGFGLNLEEFALKVTNKTKAVIINSPNNPSGVIYTTEELSCLGEILNQKEKEFGHPIYLISDEPYRTIVYDGAKVPFVSRFYKNTFICYSFSKSLSLPGERIGYILLDRQADDFDEIIDALSVANRISGFVNAPSLFQKVLPYCMDEKTDIAAYDKNRNLLYDMLTELGFACKKPAGAFYMFPKSPIADDVAFCAAAKEQRILSAPGSAFHCPGYFRLAFCVPKERIERSYPSFKALADKYIRHR